MYDSSFPYCSAFNNFLIVFLLGLSNPYIFFGLGLCLVTLVGSKRSLVVLFLGGSPGKVSTPMGEFRVHSEVEAYFVYKFAA